MRKLIALLLLMLLSSLSTGQAQSLDCTMVQLEHSSGMPGDLIPIRGLSTSQTDVSVSGMAGDAPLDLLLYTDDQPLIFAPEVDPPSITLMIDDSLSLYAEASTDAQVIGTIAPNTTITVYGSDIAGDWVQIETQTMIGLQTGWVSAPLLDGDFSILPNITEDTVFLTVPFHPDDALNGGEIAITVGNCNPILLTVSPLPNAAGSFNRAVQLIGELLTLQRESFGMTRETLLATEPINQPPHLVTLAINQRLYDADNGQSLVAIQQQIDGETYSEAEVQLLDAVIAKTNLITYLEDELATYTALITARNEQYTMKDNIFKPSMQTTLQYPEINNAEDLAREMTAATSALYRLNGGASGRVLNDLGVVAAVGSLFAGEGTPLDIVLTVAGKLLYVEKSRLEVTAYSGPTVFTDFRVTITPEIFLNENGVSSGDWTVSATVATTPWRITRLNAYDAARYFDAPGSGTVDVISAVCGGNGSPCGEIPEFVTIEAHTWTINDMDEFWLFEARRPAGIPGNTIYTYALPNPLSLRQPSNNLTPINAGRYPLIIRAPYSDFGLYKGDGFGRRDVIVSEIEITHEPSNNPPDLILAPGETVELCYVIDVEHALPEDNRKDVRYEVKNSNGTMITSDELLRGLEFCFTAGPIEPAEWITCDELRPSFEHYTIDLISLAENGPRDGAEWHPEALAPPRTESFFVRVDAEEPEKPDNCHGVWYLVPGDIVMSCPNLSTTIPVNAVPIPINAESLNTGTSAWGQLDQVLTMPGAELIPPDVTGEIIEADQLIDDLQTTNEELDPLGRLFTRVPDIAQAGASYVVVLPVDSSGMTAGEVLFSMTFSTDEAFTGELLMNLDAPGVGSCEVTMAFNGYFDSGE